MGLQLKALKQYIAYENQTDDVKITGDLDVTGTLLGTGNVTLSGNLAVTGTLSTTGSVGIGTATPGTKLEVVGTAKISGITEVASIVQVTGGGGTVNPTAQGIELRGGTLPSLTAYNRSGGVNIALIIDALTHDLQVSGASKMFIATSGNTGINTVAPNAVAQLDVVSTTKGFLPPRMTDTQRDAIAAPPAGLFIYNSTTNKLNVRVAAAWEAITSTTIV